MPPVIRYKTDRRSDGTNVTLRFPPTLHVALHRMVPFLGGEGKQYFLVNNPSKQYLFAYNFVQIAQIRLVYSPYWTIMTRLKWSHAMMPEIEKQFSAAVDVIRQTGEQMAPSLVQAAEMIVSALREGGRVFTFGNGGSAADAQHIAAELVGRFKRDRAAFAAEALTTDTSAMTAIANDFGFDTIFARQLEGKGRVGDVAIGISTSGNSPNVLAGLAQARAMGMKTIAMTGAAGGEATILADVLLASASDDTPRIQEAHQVMYHLLCDLTEAAMVD